MKKTKMSKDQAIKAMVDSASGKSIRSVAQDTGISNRAARTVAAAAGMHVEELRAEVASNLRSAQLKLAKKLNDEVQTLHVSQASVPFGIITEKLNLIEGVQPPAQTQILGQINGESKTKEQVIAGLFGNARSVPEFHQTEPVKKPFDEGCDR